MNLYVINSVLIFSNKAQLCNNAADENDFGIKSKGNKEKTCKSVLKQNVREGLQVESDIEDGGMSYEEYRSLAPDSKNKLNNRIRQWAHRSRSHLPNRHFLFCLVLSHLLKNAHTYFNMEKPTTLQMKLLDQKSFSDTYNDTVIADFKEVNKRVREVGEMKQKNRKEDQRNIVSQLKGEFGSCNNIAKLSGISRKSVQKWFAEEDSRPKKRVEMSNLKKEEYHKFLAQDTVSFEHPSKKYAGRRYLRNTIKEIRKIYVDQTEFHTYGMLSETRMKEFRPDNVFLCAKTPMESSLCQGCENCEKVIKALLAIGLKCVPANRYEGVNAIVCQQRSVQHGTSSSYAPLKCIQGKCDQCGVDKLIEKILKENTEIMQRKSTVTWKQWKNVPGRKAPDIVHTKGTIHQCLESLSNILKVMAMHLFRSNWNRNLFDYIRKHLFLGVLAQIFDFSMNFRNTHQDEIQSAFFEATQTSIHTIINYFLCLNSGCSEVVTLVVCQISEDLRHDSFFARAAHDETFKYLAELGVPMEHVIQFSDNCSSQYKSRRPFAELARSKLNITRVYFGERHGKSQCDGFFGRLKKFVTTQVKTRNAEISTPEQFFRLCKEKYEKAPIPGQCLHYRVVFQYLKPAQMRRHQDCDLQHAIEGTRQVYSVKNTSDPLKIKIRNVPCICHACIQDNGEKCENYEYADEWREVQLVPKNPHNFKKKQSPVEILANSNRFADKHDEDRRVNGNGDDAIADDSSDEESLISDGELPLHEDLHEHPNGVRDIYVDLTKDEQNKLSFWSESEDDELLTANEEIYKEDELPDIDDEDSIGKGKKS